MIAFTTMSAPGALAPLSNTEAVETVALAELSASLRFSPRVILPGDVRDVPSPRRRARRLNGRP